MNIWEWMYSSTILDLGTRWRCVVSFTPQPLYLIKIGLGAHWIGGWVGPRTGLDIVAKIKTLPLRGFKSRKCESTNVILVNFLVGLRIFFHVSAI
jgi:hypothetical protein